MPEKLDSPAHPIAEALVGYGGEDAPLPQYAALVAVFGTLATALLAAENSRAAPPTRLSFGDFILLGVATHKLSRLISKDRVTSPFRAPFAKFVESAGAGEVEEEARGRGMQKAIGELVTCPFCVSPWAALALTSGLMIAPRATRLLCGLLSSVALSHFLHHAYIALEEQKEQS